MSHDVFISYSSRDKAFADAICHQLEAAKIRCWIAPRDINPSEDWAESIINGLDAAKLLVLVFSSNSNKSPQVKREVERSVSKGRAILPFRIEDVPLSKSLEYFISSQHWLDAINGDLQVHLSRLVESVNLLLSRSTVDTEFTRALDLRGLNLLMPIPRVAAPLPPPMASGVSLNPDTQAQLTTALAQAIGPIAKHLVKRQITQGAPSLAQLVQALALEIDNPAERQRFLVKCTSWMDTHPQV